MPLAEYLEDYRRELEARGNDPRYVGLVHCRLRALFEGCGFRLLSDLSASGVMDWLARQRCDTVAPDLLVSKGEFTRCEAGRGSGRPSWPVSPPPISTSTETRRPSPWQCGGTSHGR